MADGPIISIWCPTTESLKAIGWDDTPPRLLDELRAAKAVRDAQKPIGLVACSKSKRSDPCEARSLYRGVMFEKSRMHVTYKCDGWGILSAKYSLLLPDQVVAPYDETMNQKDPEEREHWETSVNLRIKQVFPDWKTRNFLVLAPKAYRGGLCGLHTISPFQGMRGNGDMLRYLTEANKLIRRITVQHDG